MSTPRLPRHATKIVATLGPASTTLELLEQMIRAGVNVVRLNFSHGTAQDHIDRAAHGAARRPRAQRPRGGDHGRPAGPEDPRRQVRRGQGLARARRQVRARCRRAPSPATSTRVGLDYKDLPRDVKPGDMPAAQRRPDRADGRRGQGRRRSTPRCACGGELSNNKGINKQGGGLTAPALTAKDMEDIKTAMSFQADYVAVSFPKNATDMEMARQLCNVAAAEFRHKPAMIAKIERAEAIPGCEEILRRQRRHHGGARRPGGGGRQCRGAGAAEAHDPHGARTSTRWSSPRRR